MSAGAPVQLCGSHKQGAGENEKKKSFFFCFTKNRSVTGQLQVL